ncbi:hypothetical protein PENTCL1PPCAC_28741, partial [Pristionchus entomophagus]
VFSFSGIFFLRQESIWIVHLRIWVCLLISVYEERGDDETASGGFQMLTHLEIVLERADDVGYRRKQTKGLKY